MWVSRFIIRGVPVNSGCEDVAVDRDLLDEAAYQIGVIAAVWNDARDRLASLGDYQPFRLKLVQ